MPRSMSASIFHWTSFAALFSAPGSVGPPVGCSGCNSAPFFYNPIIHPMLDVIILLCLIFLNGLFVMAEIALVSARKSRLENLADNGDDKARSALKLAENPELFLSTAQIGITLIAILTGFYSGEKFSADLQPYLEKIPFLRHYAANLSTALILVLVTLLSIIFGELIPKRIGLLRAEQIARMVARPVRVLSLVTYPIVWLLNNSSNIFFNFFKI